MSSFTQPHAIPNPHDFVFIEQHTRRMTVHELSFQFNTRIGLVRLRKLVVIKNTLMSKPFYKVTKPYTITLVCQQFAVATVLTNIINITAFLALATRYKTLFLVIFNSGNCCLKMSKGSFA